MGKTEFSSTAKTVEQTLSHRYDNLFFSAVEAVMNKKPLKLSDTTLDIRPYEPLLQGDECINGIEIRGLPSALTEDV